MEIETYKTKDGLILHGVVYNPEEKTNKVLLHVPGMGGNFYENSFINFIGKTLTDQGIAFAAFNNRGNGAQVGVLKDSGGQTEFMIAGNSTEIFEDCVLDIKAQIDFLQELGFNEIHLSGHSLGTPKVAYYLSDTSDERIKSLIFISPTDMRGLVINEENYEGDMKLALEMESHGDESKLMPALLWDEYPISAKTYLSLFSEESKSNILNFRDLDLDSPGLARIRQPIFSVMGKKDSVILTSVEDTFAKIKKDAKSSSRVESEILDDASHSFHGYEQKLANTLLKWIKSFES